jgi:hypothetical protein
MIEDPDAYISYTIKLNKEITRLETRYHDAVAWLAFSAVLNVALLAGYLWEVSR